MRTSDELSHQTEDLTAQAKDVVRKVGDQINEQANYLRDATAAVRYNTQDFIESNPWQSVAIAVGIGFLIGVVVARR